MPGVVKVMPPFVQFRDFPAKAVRLLLSEAAAKAVRLLLPEAAAKAARLLLPEAAAKAAPPGMFRRAFPARAVLPDSFAAQPNALRRRSLLFNQFRPNSVLHSQNRMCLPMIR